MALAAAVDLKPWMSFPINGNRPFRQSFGVIATPASSPIPYPGSPGVKLDLFLTD